MKMMKWTRVALLFYTLSLIIIMCQTTPTVLSAPTKESFNDNLPLTNQTLKLKCKKPQPRAYNLFDLLMYHQYPIQNEVTHEPSYIIVYRCDGHSGCCSTTNKICKPVEAFNRFEKFEFTSNVTDSQNHSKIVTKTIEIEHHMKCRCFGAGFIAREEMELKRPSIKFV